MAEFENSEEFLTAIAECKYEAHLVFNTIDQIVTAYAGSANCDPKLIPHLYAALYDLFTKGELP